MTLPALDDDLVDFGDIPAPINALLQEGVYWHPADPARARACFRSAIDLAPDVLPSYRCLFKAHNKQRDFAAAYAVALEGLGRAAMQAGMSPDWSTWTRPALAAAPMVPARFLLHSLKAVAFIELRRGHESASRAALAHLQALDPEDGVGASVIAALLDREDA